MSTEDQTSNSTTSTTAARKSKAQVLQELEAQARKIREKRSKLLGQQKSEERKLATKQAVIVGAWLRANSPEHWNQVVSRLTRPQDREAFGLDPLPATPADPAAGGDQHTS